MAALHDQRDPAICLAPGHGGQPNVSHRGRYPPPQLLFHRRAYLHPVDGDLDPAVQVLVLGGGDRRRRLRARTPRHPLPRRKTTVPGARPLRAAIIARGRQPRDTKRACSLACLPTYLLTYLLTHVLVGRRSCASRSTLARRSPRSSSRSLSSTACAPSASALEPSTSGLYQWAVQCRVVGCTVSCSVVWCRVTCPIR